MASENITTSKEIRVNEAFDSIVAEVEKSESSNAQEVIAKLEEMRYAVKAVIAYDSEEKKEQEARAAEKERKEQEFIASIACIDGDPEKGFITDTIVLTEQDLETMKQMRIPFHNQTDDFIISIIEEWLPVTHPNGRETRLEIQNECGRLIYRFRFLD